MIDATVRWTLYVVALLVAGPIAGLLMNLSDAPNGAAGTVLVVSSPILGLIGLLLGSAIAAGLGALAAWRCGLRAGLTCAGLVFCWMAGTSSGLTQAIVASDAWRSGPWMALIAEGVLVAA